MESRKQAVSIRMSAADVRKIKRLAERLGVRDSDVIRFAVKSLMSRLGPLHDPSIRGSSLVPVLLDCSHELFQHFDLDAVRLEGIVNDGVEPAARVSRDDIQLIAMNGTRQPYLRWSIEQRAAKQAVKNGSNGSAVRLEGNGSLNSRPNGTHSVHDESDGTALSVRAYLFEKYVYGDGDPR